MKIQIKDFGIAGISAIIFLLFLTPALAGTIRIQGVLSYPKETKVLKGVIVSVTSAGEMALWEKGRLHPFRLFGIDLPEPETSQGAKAKQIVSDLVFNTLLSVYLLPGKTSPPYAVVIIRDTCLNQTLVRMGTARLSDDCNLPAICNDWKRPQEQIKDTAKE